MVFVEGRDEDRIKDVRSGNPGSFFGSISFPIYEILKSTPSTANIQDTIDRICWVVINESSVGWGLGRWTQGAWKVGWVCMEDGSLSLTADGLLIPSMRKGPM
ncbi:hypothetical protein ILYODFUR_038816 [Ilyodon furcidens]|uniref:Uncharacterized protein n=1 Tax=Ilyodon furcidens TaxID=33524 RepID=A0ABV0V9P6_9TELE